MLVNEIYEKYKDAKEFDVKTSTIQTLMPKIDRHIIPYFGDENVENITMVKAREWQKTLLSKGLSIAFINDITIRFSTMLNFAFEYEYISFNPLKRLKALKDHNKAKKKENYWTLAEFNSFIDIVLDPTYNLLYYFLFYTGLRRGEMKALTWNDFDLLTGKISITKQMIKLKGNSQAITSPKSDASYRDIYVHRQLHNKLLAHYNQAKESEIFAMSDFIFGGKKPLSNTTLDRKLKAYIQAAKVKKITMHGFRHSHASFMIQSLGINILALAQRLGHEDVSETLNTYSHMYEDEKKSLAIDIEKYIIENEASLKEFDKLISNIHILVQEHSNTHTLTPLEASKINVILGAINC